MYRPLTCLVLLSPFLCIAADPVKLDFLVVSPESIQQRLETVPRTLAERKSTLITLFQEVGCEVVEQRVPGSKAGNLICTLPGEGSSAIVVGGHYDFIDRGTGAIDDWSGSVMLPSLYQSLKTQPRRHRFIFIAFAAEEVGLHGSEEYVKKLPREDRAAIHAMINLECLGTSSPKIWATRADKRLANDYVRVAQQLNLQPAGSNVDQVGDDDSHPFLNAHIPVLTIHSVTNDSLPLLHSKRDNVKAIHPDDYYDSYRLAAMLLALVDVTEP